MRRSAFWDSFRDWRDARADIVGRMRRGLGVVVDFVVGFVAFVAEAVVAVFEDGVVEGFCLVEVEGCGFAGFSMTEGFWDFVVLTGADFVTAGVGRG